MCVSAFVFGEFILLSVQPVALATSVIETLTFPVRISVLRIGFAVYALYCASFPTSPTMASPKRTPNFTADEDFSFSGENITDWFRFDRIITRRSKKLFHKQGPQFWNNSAVAIDANSVQAIASDTYDGLIKIKGLKEANACWEWDYFWTVSYQQQWRKDAIDELKDYVESRCTGKAAIKM